jgi:hypothetical protein
MGAWFLEVPISSMAKLSADKIIILWGPRKFIPKGLVG